jgi:RNA polymerase sigma-70 factor (ECF subfamily)
LGTAALHLRTESPISTIVSSPDDAHERAIERAFVSRESWAFEAAYRTHARHLVGAALSVLRDSQAAQDCVHDVLARLWQRGHGYRPERGSLGAFLVVCIRNEALSRVRRDANRSRIERSLAVDDAYTDEFGDPVERDRIRRCVQTLGDDQRSAVLMAYFKHMTHEEIARELGIPLGTVKSRLSSALRNLRAALASEGNP